MRKRTVVIVGSDSLLGREVHNILSEQAPDVSVDLIGDEAGSAIITERDGEPVVVSALDKDTLASAQAAFLTGSSESSLRCAETVETMPGGPALIDLTNSLEEREGARVRAPLVDLMEPSDNASGVYVSAHPAAIVLAEFFRKLGAARRIRRSLAHVFEPASERGREGIDELQRQTVSLLSFKALPQDVFDAQIAFNMLARYGPESRTSLESIEARVARQLKELLRTTDKVPPPSLRMLQAPVFHAHCFSVWVEFRSAPTQRSLIRALASDRIEVRSADEQPATNSGVAGQSGMTVGRIELDRDNAKAAWFWIVADNHRVAAENAVCLAQLLLPVEGAA